MKYEKLILSTEKGINNLEVYLQWEVKVCLQQDMALLIGKTEVITWHSKFWSHKHAINNIDFKT